MTTRVRRCDSGVLLRHLAVLHAFVPPSLFFRGHATALDLRHRLAPPPAVPHLSCDSHGSGGSNGGGTSGDAGGASEGRTKSSSSRKRRCGSGGGSGAGAGGGGGGEGPAVVGNPFREKNAYSYGRTDCVYDVHTACTRVRLCNRACGQRDDKKWKRDGRTGQRCSTRVLLRCTHTAEARDAATYSSTYSSTYRGERTGVRALEVLMR
jgi:hypothetical protein